MKIVYIFLFSFMFSALLQAQDASANLASSLTTEKYRLLFARNFSGSTYTDTALGKSMRSDTMPHNAYGDLREDIPEYNQKSPLWSVGARVVLNNAVTVAFDMYILNADYAKVGPRTWRHNFETGWEWDVDRFGMNYFAHPYSGSGYFNAARSNGYSFYESIPFAIGGSLMYEYLGENTLPSINDVINTTFTGVFLGEISYRLSSNFLDDRSVGAERFFRELFATVIDPQRGFSRLLHGRLTRGTVEEIYQKEPLDMTFGAGMHLVNDGRTFGTGYVKQMLTLKLDYGNPFERRSRKVYDYFRLRADLTNGLGRKIIDNIIGQAFLFGGNTRIGNLEMLIGGFQHYDFWDNNTFEIGTIGFGGGVLGRMPVTAGSTLLIDAHLAVVPLGGNSTELGPDSSEFRDYNYGGGAEGKLEATLNLGTWASVILRSNYYWIHTYVGIAGDNFVGIVRPIVVFRLVDNLSLGIEHLVYYSERYAQGFRSNIDVRTEQKIFLQFVIENFQ